MAKTVHWFFTFLLLGFAVYMLYLLHKTQVQLDKIENKKQVHYYASPKHEDIEVVHYMQRIQLFHLKLYFAGKENNKELVAFYLHEIKEEMEVIEKSRIKDDDINISQMMKQIGLPALENFEYQYKSKPEIFESLFFDFTQSCNSCHSAVNHTEIKIKAPDFNPFSNQEFKPR